MNHYRRRIIIGPTDMFLVWLVITAIAKLLGWLVA